MPGNLRVVFIGYGAINSRVGELLKKRGVPVEIVGVATRDDRSERAHGCASPSKTAPEMF